MSGSIDACARHTASAMALEQGEFVRIGARHVLLGVLLLLAGGLAAPNRAGAEASSARPAWASDVPGWQWSSPEEFELPGARLRVQHLRAPGTPAEVARALAEAAQAPFDRLQRLPTGLQLSGLQAGDHWLAQLWPRAEGTRAVVSRLHPDGLDAPPARPRAAAAASASFEAARFAPAGAQRLLQARTRPAHSDAHFSLFTGRGTPQTHWPGLRARLQAAGWHAEPTSASREEGAAAVRQGRWQRADGALLSAWMAASDPARYTLSFWFRSSQEVP